MEPAGDRLIVAGDWNTARGQGSERGRRAGKEFFDRPLERADPNAVSSPEHAACTITVEFPGGGSLMSNTIFDIERGKIVRQLDIQVADPS